MLLDSFSVVVGHGISQRSHDYPADPIVRGLVLRPGHSSKTDQYGLAVDNIVAINVVLYNGTSVTTTKDDHGDLFWALKVSLARGY